MVVQIHLAMQRGFQILAGLEMVALQHLLDPAVEALEHIVGLRMLRWGKTMFDAAFGAAQVKRVLAGGALFAQAKQTVAELAAIVGQNRPDP